MRIVMKKLVGSGESVPRGHGFSYFSANSSRWVFYPFPINHVVRWARDAWFFVLHAAREKAIDDAYERGWSDGRKQTDAHITAMFKIIAWWRADAESRKP